MNDHLTETLANFTKRYRKLNREVNNALECKEEKYPDAPKWCLLPYEAWYHMACDYLSRQRLKNRPGLCVFDDETVSNTAYELMMIGSWRYSMGVYDFDEDVYPELIKTPFKGDLPEEILSGLPEWTQFIRTPDFMIGNRPLYGFWVGKHWSTNVGPCLCLQLSFEGDPTFRIVKLPLGRSFCLEKATATMCRIWRLSSKDPKKDLVNPLKSLINLVLYLCAKQPEDPKIPGGNCGTRTASTRTKKGRTRFLVIEDFNYYKTGTGLGRRIRVERSSYEGSGSDKPIVRCSHWHTYWMGPKNNKKASMRLLSTTHVKPYSQWQKKRKRGREYNDKNNMK